MVTKKKDVGKAAQLIAFLARRRGGHHRQAKVVMVAAGIMAESTTWDTHLQRSPLAIEAVMGGRSDRQCQANAAIAITVPAEMREATTLKIYCHRKPIAERRTHLLNVSIGRRLGASQEVAIGMHRHQHLGKEGAPGKKLDQGLRVKAMTATPPTAKWEQACAWMFSAMNLGA
jgi:hypothetical protein